MKNAHGKIESVEHSIIDTDLQPGLQEILQRLNASG